MNHIENIEIKNFKSIRHQKIEGCKRINVFVGPPNVGKSNVLEAMGLFSLMEIFETSNIPFKQIVRFNDLPQLFYNGDVTSKIEICVNDYFFAEINHLDVDGKLEIYSTKELQNTTNTIVPEKNTEIKIPLLEGWLNENSKVNQFSKAAIVNQAIAEKIERIRPYRFSGSNNSLTALSLKSLGVPFGENISKIIFSIPKVKKEIIELFERFGLSLSSFSNSTIKLLKRLDDGSHFILDYDMIADTLQRVVFSKVAILSNNNAVLLLEEPEANCYEPYILEITNEVKNDNGGNQFFIVTHSQYVIDELLRDNESRNDTNIYLVGSENGETKIKLLNRENNEDVFERGLNVFFNYQTLWDEN